MGTFVPAPKLPKAAAALFPKPSIMENIVVGISLSEQSSYVFRFALRLAQHFSAHLHAVHIIDKDGREMAGVNIMENENLTKALGGLKEKKEAELERFMAQYLGKQYRGISVDRTVKFGYVYEGLCRQAKADQADLIIVGKHTKTAQALFGDMADKLIGWAPCPLFIVPEDAEYHAFNQMVYAADFILEDCAAILHLQEWLTAFRAKLICLHICRKEAEREAALKKLDILRRLFPQDNMEFRCIVAEVEKGIGRYVSLSRSNLVATTHRRSHSLWDVFFKKSMSKALARDVQVPMMIFQQF